MQTLATLTAHRAGETSWAGRTPLTAVAEPGDTLLFRSDVWQ